MNKYGNNRLEDLDITKAELKEFEDALKKDEFRKLLSEYVEEVSDPKNRETFEREVAELEKDRGVDVTFIHPTPGYVIKTSVDGTHKAFINICSNKKIDQPVATNSIKDGKEGKNWSIPHILVPPKDDLDKKGHKCVVYDVVFHPLTLNLAKSKSAFKALVNDTALTGIEDAFQVKIDRNNIKFPKLQFKGPKVAPVIRRKNNNYTEKQSENSFPLPNYPYGPIKSDDEPKVIHPVRSNSTREYTTPHYIIKHRKGFDLMNCTNAPDAKFDATVPTELVIEIKLPLLSSASDALLDVTSKHLTLISEKPSKYKLELNLPYNVDENKGSAKFDKKSKQLQVTLPVVGKSVHSLLSLHADSSRDSGIESDPCHNKSSSDEDLSSPVIEVPKSLPQNNTTFRTSAEISGEFLSSKLHYIFPSYSIRNHSNSVIITLHVGNVVPESVSHQYISSESCVHFKFTSFGSGGFPLQYTFCIKYQGFSIDTSSLKVEVWDNNLIVSNKVISQNNNCLNSYFVGPTPDSLVEETFSASLSGDALLEEAKGREEERQGDIEFTQASTENKIFSEALNDVGEEELTKFAEVHLDSGKAPVVRKEPKMRTYSESHADLPQPKCPIARRSILKSSRSLSESHSDDYVTWSSLDSSDNTEDTSGQKKTVRFSDVISKKVFRVNSSILGQKHKNEKKAKNRKKMARRRAESSGENSEVSDFSDYSEVSDISDVSDVSDASSDDQSNPSDASTQIASGKHHRRRGSKNRRKNAATAKQNFILSQD